MTIANHALVGAGIALVVRQPALALTLALLSHFVLDALPHFGYNREGIGASLHHRLTYFVQFLALVGIILLLMIMKLHTWVILGAMILAISPDFDWIYRYFYHLVTKRQLAETAFSKFHRAIQWGERPWGIWIEIAFFVAGYHVLLWLPSR